MFLSYFVLTHLSAIGYNSTQTARDFIEKGVHHEQEPPQQVVLDRRGFVAATFANRCRPCLAGCSDTSAEADKGSAAGSSKSPEDTGNFTTLDAKAFDKLPPTTAPKSTTMPSPPAPGPRPSRRRRL